LAQCCCIAKVFVVDNDARDASRDRAS